MDSADLLTNIRRIIRSVNLESKRIEKEFGVSIPQLLCLKFLNKRDDYAASHKEIKDYLSLNASTVTGIINRLERKGLVAKLPPSPEDRRVSKVTITARGAELLEGPTDLMHERLNRRLRALSAEELAELERSFERINKFLDVEEVEAVPIITGDLEMKPENGDGE